MISNLLEQLLFCPTDEGVLKGMIRSLPARKVEYLRCSTCQTHYPLTNGIPQFHTPPYPSKRWQFEINRYNKIARTKPDSWGLDATYPKKRVTILKKALKKPELYLNIGPGFGQLEEKMPGSTKVCFDQSIGFLELLKTRGLPKMEFVCGFAERMPFKNEVFPAVISDSTFQTVIDQQEFLFENIRVLKPEGTFVLATHYRWNYPRKPQAFPAVDHELLRKYLHELGVEATITYYNLAASARKQESSYDEGDYLVATGTKQ